MKKILLTISLILICFTISGCQKSETINDSLEDIMNTLYEVVPEDERPMMLSNTVVTKDNVEYYLGTSNIEFKEALASEPQVSSIPHSIVLIRINEGQDITQLKEAIKENVNPWKWVCVGIEDDKVIVESNKDLVVLIMTENYSQEILKKFMSL